MKKQKGVSIVETAIILALVSVVVIGAYYYLGGTINEALSFINNILVGANNQMDENAKYDQIKSNMISAGSLGGTIKNPVEVCAGGLCTVDYGSFVLNGVPEDFGEFVETAGASGANNQIAGYFDKIAKYLEQSGDKEGYEEYKNLSNLSYFFANMEKVTEDAVTTCQKVPSGQVDTCIKRYLDDHKIGLPPNLDTVIPKYDKINTDLIEMMDTGKLNIARALNDLQSSPHLDDTSRQPAYALATIYKSIMENDKYSIELKNITQELYANVADLSVDQVNKVLCMTGRGCTPNVFDPITLEKKNNVDYKPLSTSDQVLAPNASAFTDLDAALICVAGQNTVDGHSCHKDNKGGKNNDPPANEP